MRNEQNAVLASLRRTQQFLGTHSEVLTVVAPATRTQLDAVVAQLTKLSVVQDSGARSSKGETARQRALCAVLRRTHMAPIAGIAKYVLRDAPEFRALMLPALKSGRQTLITAAYAMADAATPHTQILIDNGSPATFAADLRSAADQVSESVTGRATYQGRRAGATAGLRAAEKAGRAILRVLDVLVRARFATDAQVLAEWNAAKLVHRKSGPAVGSQVGAHASDAAGVKMVGGVMPASTSAMSTATPVPVPMGVAA